MAWQSILLKNVTLKQLSLVWSILCFYILLKNKYKNTNLKIFLRPLLKTGIDSANFGRIHVLKHDQIYERPLTAPTLECIIRMFHSYTFQLQLSKPGRKTNNEKCLPRKYLWENLYFKIFPFLKETVLKEKSQHTANILL